MNAPYDYLLGRYVRVLDEFGIHRLINLDNVCEITQGCSNKYANNVSFTMTNGKCIFVPGILAEFYTCAKNAQTFGVNREDHKN